MFQNAPFILTPGSDVSSQTIAYVQQLVSKTGAVPISLSAQRHDQIVGMVSHLPHLCAVALLNTIAGFEDKDLALTLAAGGFCDLTRVASGSPKLWREILGSNRWVAASLVGRLQKSLQALKELLEQGELSGLEALLADAQKTRSLLPLRRKGLLGSSFQLVLSLPDEPGSLAAVTGLLAEKEINIQDLEILRIREGEGGTVRVSFRDQNAQEAARGILAAAGFQPLRQE